MEVILSSVTEKMYDACVCICVVLEYSVWYNLVGQIPTSFRVRGEGVWQRDCLIHV